MAKREFLPADRGRNNKMLKLRVGKKGSEKGIASTSKKMENRIPHQQNARKKRKKRWGLWGGGGGFLGLVGLGLGVGGGFGGGWWVVVFGVLLGVLVGGGVWGVVFGVVWRLVGGLVGGGFCYSWGPYARRPSRAHGGNVNSC